MHFTDQDVTYFAKDLLQFFTTHSGSVDDTFHVSIKS